jgi:hypothetical protein
MASGTAWGIFADGTRSHTLAWPATAAAAWLAVAGALKVAYARWEDSKAQQQESPKDLAGCVHVLYRVLQRISGFSDDDEGRVRITVHRVVPARAPDTEPAELEQVIPYVGGAGGGPGRRFRIESGIIGLAIRDGDVYKGARQNDDYEAYLNELVQEWEYTRQAAERLRRDRQSWMAVPLFSQGQQRREVIGGVYLDSDQRGLFDDEEVVTMITHACFGIAAYIDERYG